MNAHVTIHRADSPCARCINCGSEQQYHGRPGRLCTSFEAETINDIDPAELSNADLIRAVTLATHEINAIDRLVEPAREQNDRHTHQRNRRQDCLAEIVGRHLAVFGLGWDDFKSMMEDL